MGVGRLERIERKLEGTGIVVATHSPGDGVTRYKFGRADLGYGDGYFGMKKLHTVLGVKAAEAFAAGVRVGWESRKYADQRAEA